MNKKGFTLMELLAVIVIIAIITLITIPVVGNIIEKSKKDAFLRSIEGITREYEYKEVQTDTKLGMVNACSLQEECKLQGTVDRNSNNEILVTLSNGKYCGAGILGDITVTEGRCDINLGTALVSDISPVDYDGTAHEPVVEVVLGGVTLVSGSDYIVSYEDNINAGIGKVIITGKGDYKGSITKSFIINRVEAPNSEILGSTLTYNGLSQSLITSVNVSNSNVYYNIGTELNSSNYNTLGSLERPSAINAGTYIVYYYAPASGNYNEIKGSVESVINKATPTMEIVGYGYGGKYYLGENGIIEITGSNYGTLTCSSSNESIVLCSVSNSVITVEPVSEGTTTLTIIGSGNDNYNEISKTYFTVIEHQISTCPYCVYMYTTNEESTYYGGDYTPSTLMEGQYKKNYKDVIAETGKNYFLGLKLDSQNKIEKAYACGLLNAGTSEEKAFCIQGYTDSTYYETNKEILRYIYGSSACTDYSSERICSGTVNSKTEWSGGVSVGVNNNFCDVNKWGNVYCR